MPIANFTSTIPVRICLPSKTQLTLSIVLILALHLQPAHAANDKIKTKNGDSLSEIIKLGLKNSPTLAKYQASLNAAQALTVQKKREYFPTLDAIASATNKDSSSTLYTSTGAKTDDYLVYLDAKLPIYSGGATSGAISVSRHDEAIQLETLNQQKELLIYNITLGYFNVTQYMRLQNAANENLEILKKYAAVIDHYVKIGRARTTDKLLTLVNLTTAQANTKDIAAKLYEQTENLRQLLAIEKMPKIDLPETITIEEMPTLSSEQATQNAFQDNSDIQIYKLQKAKVTSEKKVALAEDLPSLYIDGQLGYRSPQQEDLFKSNSEYNAVALSLKIPLFSGLTSMAKRRNYEEKITAASQDIALKKIDVAAQLSSLIQTATSNYEQLKIIKLAATNAKQALILANKDYQRGLISSQDLLNIQRTRYDTEQLLIKTNYNYSMALLKIRHIMGADLESNYVR